MEKQEKEEKEKKQRRRRKRGEAREKDNTISPAWRVLSMIGKCINCIECT